MKTLVASLVTGGVCVAATAWIVANRVAERHAVELTRERAAWAEEKSQLEASLKRAKGRTTVVETATHAAPTPAAVATPPRPNPREIIERLKATRLAAVPAQTRATRRLLHEFESLVDAGPAALSAIREFLARNEELNYQPDGGKGSSDGRVQTDVLVPPSLRLGLFDVMRQIGGEAAETLLAEVLRTTGRGFEVAYLARVLQEMAPNKYRDIALAAAKELLANPLAGAIDRNDRNYLFGVLAFFNDSSYGPSAQAQLVQASNQVDRAALKYLQQTLGEQAVPLVAQAYADPRVTADEAKEPLARVALAFVGVNPQAEQMFLQAIRDPALTPDHVRQLVEDLNQDGISNGKNPTAQDLKLIEYRHALTEHHLTQPYVRESRPLLNGFLEANRDLAKMLERAATASPKP
jgi:hypothetical protein